MLLVMYLCHYFIHCIAAEFWAVASKLFALALDGLSDFVRASVLQQQDSVKLDAMSVPGFYTRLRMLCEVVRRFVLRPYI